MKTPTSVTVAVAFGCSMSPFATVQVNSACRADPGTLFAGAVVSDAQRGSYGVEPVGLWGPRRLSTAPGILVSCAQWPGC